jgi:pimeloyl-ACP methyl ester carboxylesterase
LFLDKKNPAIEATRARALSTPKASILGYAEAMRDRPDRSETFFRTPLPALLIGGVNDVLIPITDLQAIAKNSPNSEFHKLEGVAHMGIFEAKNQCQTIVLRFAAHLWTDKGI